MCTVTFVKTSEGFCITSNRDENTNRPKAFPPKEYEINGKKITFPKDALAGGSWIAIDDNQIIVLLNGAKEKHEHQPPYRKSRGIILLDLFEGNSVLENWNKINLENIEPFTLVYFNRSKLYQLQWNAIEKNQLQLDTEKPHIWSSSTLYTKEKREIRQQWFNDFLKEEKEITPEKIVGFHQFTHPENKDFGLKIDRNNQMKTISITQVLYKFNTISMHYMELQ